MLLLQSVNHRLISSLGDVTSIDLPVYVIRLSAAGGHQVTLLISIPMFSTASVNTSRCQIWKCASLVSIFNIL